MKRSTIYFDPEIHRALRLKAAETEHSISDLVNEAVRYSLLQDAEDLETIRAREDEPLYSFEEVVKELKNSGKL